MLSTLSQFDGDKIAALLNDSIFSEQFLDTTVLLGISIKTGEYYSIASLEVIARAL